MDIRTENGPLDTAKLPQHEPIFCGRCGCRVAWVSSDTNCIYSLLCDDCAALVSQGESEEEQ